MAQSASGLNTNKVGAPNREGNRGYGIFQVRIKFQSTESHNNFMKTEPFFVDFIFVTMMTEEVTILAQKLLEYIICASYYIIQVYVHILVTCDVV